MNDSRRKFLRTSVCGLTGAAMLASMEKLNLVNAMVQQQTEDAVAADYRALVCIFLSGGIDSFNMLVPWEQTRYNVYSRTRGAFPHPPPGRIDPPSS